MKRTALIFILWIAFTAGCLVAPFVAIAFLFFKHNHYLGNFARAADRMDAAILGFSGRHMLSTELNYSDRLKWIKKCLYIIDKKHCEEAAYDEGVYCRLTDRTLGKK